MFNKYYQPSKKFSWAGLIILAAVLIAVGSALAWVYLWVNRNCTVVLLSIFAAILYGVIMGFVGKLVVKKCKLRNPAAVLLALIIGLVSMNYIKWAMYDYYDHQLIADAYDEYDYEGNMRRQKAYTLYYMDQDFDETYTFDENWDYLQSDASEVFTFMNTYYNEEYYSQEVIAEAKGYTLYDWYYYDILLGTNKEECKANLEKAKEMNGYEFVVYRGLDVDDFIAEYYGSYKAPSMAEILTHPGNLWADIKKINEEGRWTYTSESSTGSGSSYSNSTSSDPVNGVMLWIVWISEALIINICAFAITSSQSKHIFIEMDNDWAEEFDGNKLTFANMSKMQLKSMLEQDADNVMNLNHIDPVSLAGRPYVKLTISHSRDYSENYLNGYNMTYNAKNRNYVNTPAFKGLIITPKQAGILLSMCGVEPMGVIASDPEYMNWQSGGSNMGGGYASASQPMASAPAASAASVMEAATVTCGSCGEKMPAGKKFCPHCGAPFEGGSSGGGLDMASFNAWKNAAGMSNAPSDEMEGISTDNINIDDM